MTSHPLSRILIIAGSDPSGGAGIQGDIKTVTAMGGFACAAITALTAQNTLGVFGIHEVPEPFIAQQIRLVLEDVGADVIKTGMLHSASVINVVADILADYPAIPLIIDPVMVAKGGAALLQPDAIEALITRLIPRALLITPNIPEAECLLKNHTKITSSIMQDSAKTLLRFGSQAVLLKGGHLAGENVTDILVTRRSGQIETTAFTSPRIHTPHTHGTGCALASSIATSIAQGMTLEESIKRARHYVHAAIEATPGFGRGQGSINHHVSAL